MSRKRVNLIKAAKASKDIESFDLCCNAAPVTIHAADGDGTLKKFEMTAYNGGKMRPGGFFGDVIVDLAGVRVNGKKKPVLLNHDSEKIVGHTETIEITGTQIKASGVISGTSSYAQEVLGNARNGFPWKASIGASVEKQVFVDDGEKVEVNGKTFVGPVRVIRRAVLGEVSFVPLAADDTTRVKVAASKKKGFNMNFEKWLKARGFEPDDITDEQRETLGAAYDAELLLNAKEDDKFTAGNGDDTLQAGAGNDTLQAADSNDDIVASMREARTGELNRQNAVSKLFAGGHAELEAKAISEGWDETRAELELLRAERQTAPAGHANPGRNERLTTEILECALLQSVGTDGAFLKAQYSDKTLEAASAKEFRGYGLHQLMYDTIRAAGKSVRPGRVDNEFIREAYQADQALQAAGSGAGASTFTLTSVTSASANKALLAGYSSVDTISQLVAQEVNHKDFKAMTSYRVHLNGQLEEIGPDGEIKHTIMAEGSYTNQLKTYGRMLTLTREMQINDDLGVFLSIPRLFGRASRLTLEKTFWTLVLSNPSSFFASGNNNHQAGSGTVLQISSLTTAEQLFRDQTDAAGDPILVSPKYLIVPTSLAVTAQQLMTETRVNETTTANAPKPANNPHSGKWQPLTSPYINSQGLAGSSAVQWYLGGDPNDIPWVQIAYLTGRRTPTVESSELNFNTLGMSWRTYFDFGIAMQDTRGAVYSKGAA